MRARPLGVLGATVLLGGGSWVSAALGQQPSARDSSGVRAVTNQPAGLWRVEQRPRVRVVSRVAGIEGDPEREVGDIVSVAIRPNGNLLALDRQARLVREFDPSGRWVRNFGRAGGGPGEFSEGVDGLWLGAADTLTVADVGAQRIVRFAPDGAPAGTVPIPFGRGIAYEWRPDTTGRVLRRQVVFEGRAAEAFLKLWQGRFPPRMHAALRQNARFAERLPAFAKVRAGPEGTTWGQQVRRPGQDRRGSEMSFDPERDVGADTWDVFADDGRYLGPVTLPPRFTPLLFRGPLVVGVTRDSLDLQSLLTVRLEGFRPSGR